MMVFQHHVTQHLFTLDEITVNKKCLTSFISELDQKHRLEFMLQLINGLTIVGRETYCESNHIDIDRLININEFQHRLSRIAFDILGECSHFTDEELSEYLFVGLSELRALMLLNGTTGFSPPE